jgi:hypothetical protein
MLVWGTANPEGLDNAYNGYYFTHTDISASLQTISGTPVKIEHKGIQVGKVVSGWNNNGKMDLLLDIDETVAEGSVISCLVSMGVCNELSLGYSVQMEASKTGEDIARSKTISEVSLVRKGARDKCTIHQWAKNSKH